jgi:DNA (cytosine-5)-methyltransferase 1
MNYYNDNDPRSVAWLRELIKQNVIPLGDVDERSVTNVTGSDLKGYNQCHFFAGIGGWAEALRLAGWPTTQPVWTGSCPCQPFSCAGQRKGEKDKRHLWPEFFRLIRECRPVTVFGEQVERAIGMGWLDGIFTDLEGEGYTCGATVLGAHSVGAPHIRQRLYWVADAESKLRERSTSTNGRESGGFTDRGGFSGMADTEHDGYDRPGRYEAKSSSDGKGNRIFIGSSSELCSSGGVANSKSIGRGIFNAEDIRPADGEINALTDASDLQLRGVGDTLCQSSEFDTGKLSSKKTRIGCAGIIDGDLLIGSEYAGTGLGFWSNSVWLPCADGKARRTEPGIFPLADGVPGRVGLLRGYGNAIVPQVAAEFIKAYMDIKELKI